jgi:hypothetical protein
VKTNEERQLVKEGIIYLVTIFSIFLLKRNLSRKMMWRKNNFWRI